MSVPLPLVRSAVFGEIPPRRVFIQFDASVVSHHQPLCFDHSRTLSVHLRSNRKLPGYLFHLFCPWCCHRSHSLGFHGRYVSSVPCVCLSETNYGLPRTIVGRLRDNAFTSRVSFQVGWLSYLSVMWLATGAHTAATIGVVLCTGSCVYFQSLSGY